MSKLNYQTWSYFLRNYFRGHLNSDHSHARCVLNSFRVKLSEELQRTNNDILVKHKYKEITPYLDYVDRTWNKYNTNQLNLIDSSNRIKDCSNKLAPKAPFYYYYPIKFEEKLLKNGILETSLLDKINSNVK
jgi:hypothetical protein